MSQLSSVLMEIDKSNQNDPKKEIFENKELPNELVYAIRVTNWVKELVANPSEELLIAARGVHICRWEFPRENYPAGLQGYYQWKTFLHKFHAEKVSEIMKKFGYNEEKIQKVADIIMRKKLKQNPDTQAIEDAVSLVFLEVQLLPLMAKSTEEKVINAIAKTWAKMSPEGQKKALQLSLPKEATEIIKKAFDSNRSGSS